MTGRTPLRRIVFHIGLERTGTTWLQNYCYENRRRLSEVSILYPSEHYGFMRTNHVGLVANYLSAELHDYFIHARPNHNCLAVKSLISEINTSKARNVILSSEHFSSRLKLWQIKELANDFCDFNVTIIVFLRDHISRFFSSYATHVASGGCATIDQYCDVILQPDCLEMRYADMIGLWESVFERQNLEIRRYDRQKNILVEFFGPEGIVPVSAEFFATTKTEWRDPMGIRTNRSLGPRHTEALRRANVAASRLLWSSSALGQTARLCTWVAVRSLLHVARCIDGSDGLDRDDAWPLSATRLDHLIAVARADAVQLKQRFGVDFTV
jgi:hypothetical protein